MAEALKRNPETRLYSVMAHLNPGIKKLSEDFRVMKLNAFEEMFLFIEKVAPDFAVIGPEAPLADGAVDWFNSMGLPSFGPTQDLAKLETSKAFARILMQKHRIPGLPDFKTFSSMNGIKEYLEELGHFVVKPDGLTSGKGVKLSGEHLKDALDGLNYCGEVLKTHSSVVVEEKLEGEEFSLQSIADGKTVLDTPPAQDHKRAYVNDSGPNCYSEDTEILTEAGWKTFGSINKNVKVAVLQPRFNRIRFEKPKQVYWKKYRGEMISLKHREIDLLVTPNHRMLIRPRKNQRKLLVVEAKNLKGEFFIPQTGVWIGTTKKFMRIPKSKNRYGPKKRSVKIAFDTWTAFLGLFLSEGYVGDGRVHICQSNNSRHFHAMREILEKLPFKVSYEKKGFRINSVQLADFLLSFGKAHEKYIPPYIKNAPPKIIDIFLTAYCMGDGDIHRGQMRFCSSSKKMIDDLQELLLKTGRVGVITVDKRTKMLNPINQKHYPARPIYAIEVKKRHKTSIRKNNIKVVAYDGFIGCVTVSTGFIIVRRNGRVAICGNTGGMGSFSCENHLLPFLTEYDLKQAHAITEKVMQALSRETGKPFKGVMYGGFIVTKNGVKLLEYNARFGDPEAMNVLPIMENDFTEVLHAAVEQRLHELELGFQKKATVCKYVVPEGYPDNPLANEPVEIDSSCLSRSSARTYFGSVNEREGAIYTTGSRAIAVLGIGNSLEEAERRAEAGTQCVSGKVFHRKDIGTKELIQKRIDHVNKLKGK
jgi:phosphoribosylamine-glycine ligase